MLDIHCHILPGVDDGSKSLQESIDMLSAAKAVGVSKIVCTPHCRGHWFQYEKTLRSFHALQPYAQDNEIELTLGFEVYWEKLLELGFEWTSKLTLDESNLFLLEFEQSSFPANYKGIIEKLQNAGVDVVIAHPERYAPIQNNIAKAEELKEMGCLLQLSGDFAQAGMFSRQRRTAVKLLKSGLVDYIASDAHCVSDYLAFEKAIEVANASNAIW